MLDNINNPIHDTQWKFEVIEILEDKLSKEEFQWFITGNILKYVMRYKLKNWVEDLKKAEFYLKKLIWIHSQKTTSQ